VALLVAVVVAVLLVAPAAGATTTTVSVDDNFFEPKRVRVIVGDRVTWKWVGFVAHNVTVERGPQKFKSKTQVDGRFTRVIRKPGRYLIVCTLHPGMEMTLRATPRPPVTTTTTAATSTTVAPPSS